MDEEFIVEFILGLLFIIVPMYVKKQGDYKNFTVQYLKDIHPERLKSAYGRYINEKYREIRDNEYKEYIHKWKFYWKVSLGGYAASYSIIMLITKNVLCAVFGAMCVILVLDRIIGFNEYKERGKIEAEIERKIIIESRKYENGENPEKVVEYEDET